MRLATPMTLHITDSLADAAVRKLAAARGVSLTEAVRIACEEALARDRRARPLSTRLSGIHARMRAAADTGNKADKAFFDSEWEEAP